MRAGRFTGPSSAIMTSCWAGGFLGLGAKESIRFSGGTDAFAPHVGEERIYRRQGRTERDHVPRALLAGAGETEHATIRAC